MNNNLANLSSPTEDFQNIYSSKAENSENKLNRKLTGRNERVLPRNISDSKLKLRKTPIQLKLDQINNGKVDHEEYKGSNKSTTKNLKESRNGSLVVLSTNEHLKNISKSRPKQRPQKLIQENERISSVLKILAASDESVERTDRSKNWKN